MFPESASDFEIISAEIGDLTFYSTAFLEDFPIWFGKLTFMLEPGTHLEDVVVNVKPPRMRIRGRILLKDGTPLTNTEIALTVRRRQRDTALFILPMGGSAGVSGTNVKTDAEGYFVSYYPDEASEYSVIVKYEGASAKSKWFRLKEGERYDELVLVLRDLEEHLAWRSERVKARLSVWVVHPDSGHAYKRIKCNNWEDAKAKSVPEIQSIRYGKVRLHPHEFSYFPPIGAVTFAVKPGSDIKNVEVVMNTRPKPKIQGRLVFKNGDPLADTAVKINTGHIDFDRSVGSGYSRSLQTDADGNFVFAIYLTGIYSLSVNHRGLSAVSGPFTVEADKPHKEIVLTLNGNSADFSESPAEGPEERRYGVPDIPGVWIVNSENGHAYKWIECDDWKDAQAKASDEDAHLVTITSEAEQIWIEAVFGNGPYWIGLTDALKEGEWMWETGEPVTYTNWKENDMGMDEDVLDEPPALLKAFGAKGDRQREEEEMRDFAIISSQMDRSWDNEIGKWRATEARGTGHHGRVQMAILEKDGLRSKVHGLSLPDITPENK